MARLFLATLLSETNKASLLAVRDSLAKVTLLNPESLTWTADSKLHLTWLFLGNLDEVLLSQVQKSFVDFPERKEKSFKTPELNFDQVEIWHSDASPKHLVLTPSSVPDEFDRLALQIRDSFLPFVELKFRQQAQRALRPHITIAHFKKVDGQELTTNFSPPLDNHPLQSDQKSLRGTLVPVAFENPLTLSASSLALIESSNDNGTNYYKTIETLAIGPLDAS